MKTVLKSALCVATVALAAPAFAEETHHPQEVAQAQPAPAQPMQPGMGPGGAPMMGNPMMGGSMMGGPMMGSPMMGGQMMGGPMMGGAMMGSPMMGGHMMGGGGMMGGGMMGGPMMGMMHGGARLDGRLAFLKAELKLTAEQEKAWNDFATAVRQVAAKSRDGHGMMAMPGAAGTVTPPQMLELHEKHLAARLDAVKTLRTAVTPFYATLTDDQRKTLAELHPMFIGMM